MTPLETSRRNLFSTLLQHGHYSANKLWLKTCTNSTTQALWEKTVLFPLLNEKLIQRIDVEGQDEFRLTTEGEAYAKKRFKLDASDFSRDFSIAQPTRLSKMEGYYIPPSLTPVRC